MDDASWRRFKRSAKEALDYFDGNEEVDTDNAIEIADLLRQALFELEDIRDK